MSEGQALVEFAFSLVVIAIVLIAFLSAWPKLGPKIAEVLLRIKNSPAFDALFLFLIGLAALIIAFLIILDAGKKISAPAGFGLDILLDFIVEMTVVSILCAGGFISIYFSQHRRRDSSP